MLSVRLFGGVADLPVLHEVATAVWRVDGPLALPHVGDVTWGLYQHEPELASPKTIGIFERDGVAVAFGFVWLPQTLQCSVHPEHRDDEVYDALLDWFASAAGDELEGGLDVQLLESDTVLRSALERHGYAPNLEAPLYDHRARSLLAPVEQPPLPAGYVLRHVAGEDDLERRVEVHRAVWAPSRFTLPAYRTLRGLPPYRTDLDIVVEAPDGSFASYALAWLDEANGVGELEPVGTHPAHRRLGLGRAVCLAACRRLHALGADTAVVYSLADSPAARLYDAAGLVRVDRQIELRRPVDRPT